MVGSIDPRCETVRGIHWPKKGREVVWSSRRGSHLGQRSKATASTGRTYGCKRSDQTLKELLWHGGRPHMDSGLGYARPGMTKTGVASSLALLATTVITSAFSGRNIPDTGRMRGEIVETIRQVHTLARWRVF